MQKPGGMKNNFFYYIFGKHNTLKNYGIDRAHTQYTSCPTIPACSSCYRVEVKCHSPGIENPWQYYYYHCYLLFQQVDHFVSPLCQNISVILRCVHVFSLCESVVQDQNLEISYCCYGKLILLLSFELLMCVCVKAYKECIF